MPTRSDQFATIVVAGMGEAQMSGLGDELAEEQLLEEFLSYRKNVTRVDHTVFVSPKRNTRHAPRIKLAIDPPDSVDPRAKTASVAIGEGAVVAMRFVRLAVLALAFAATPAYAITIEFLQASIDPEHVEWLSGLSCRNYDKIVHLDISVSWPDDSLHVEKTDYQRLVFWDKSAEYLFPKDTYFILHGSWIIKGYFIARSGGMHQGIISNAFEKVNDAQVMLSPNVVERKVKKAGVINQLKLLEEGPRRK